MERKVIKFNLVGAICVLLLIIAIIVGGIVLINKINDNDTPKTNNTIESM